MSGVLESSVVVPGFMLDSTEALTATIAEGIRQLFPLQYVQIDVSTLHIHVTEKRPGWFDIQTSVAMK